MISLDFFLNKIGKGVATGLLKAIFFILRISIIISVIKYFLRYLNPRKDISRILHGHKMYVNTFDRLMAIYFWRISDSERCEHNFIKKFVSEGMIVVDVGANIGYHTLQLAQCVGDSGRVYAFEPDLENYRLLVKNIEANHYRNVIAIQKAVSDKVGMASLFICEENRGDHRLYNSNDGRKSIKVDTVTLDEYFKDKKEKIDFIKIDAQGSDCLVFSGMENIVEKNHVSVILCELAPWLLVKCGFSAEALLLKIRNLGFNIFSIDKDEYRLEVVEDKKLITQYAKEGKYTSLLLKKINA